MRASKRCGRAGLLVPLLPSVLASSAGAQRVARTQARCDGQIVNDIIVHALPPSYGGIFERYEFLSEVVHVLHVPTNESVIRRFVLLEKGKPCSPFLRQETERILRAQPFLATATVTAYPDVGGSGVRVEVVTADEPSLIAAVRVEGANPYVTSLTLGNGNLNGQGIYALGDWRHDPFYRDAYKLRLIDYQFLGQPMHLSVNATRRFQGGIWSTELSQPFLTDVQRVAWRLLTGSERSYIALSRGPNVDEVDLGMDRSWADLGGIVRVGSPGREGAPGRLSLFGASISRESNQTDFAPVLITHRGLLPDTTPLLMGRYGQRRSARVNALFGIRSIDFVKARGFEALDADQDVRRGFQLGALVGRSLSVLGTEDHDMFASMDAYVGVGTPRLFSSLQVLGEGRQSYDDSRWDSLLGAAKLTTYFKPTDWQTSRVSVEWTAGRRQLLPFQLSIEEETGGVRGFDYSEIPGGERVVAHAEHRWLLGNVRGTADVGVSMFADAGKVWRGDVPFGVTSPVYSSFGISVLAALPPHSQRLWRAEIAWPLQHVYGSGVWYRLFWSRPIPGFWSVPDDLVRTRSRTVPGSLFNWP